MSFYPSWQKPCSEFSQWLQTEKVGTWLEWSFCQIISFSFKVQHEYVPTSHLALPVLNESCHTVFWKNVINYRVWLLANKKIAFTYFKTPSLVHPSGCFYPPPTAEPLITAFLLSPFLEWDKKKKSILGLQRRLCYHEAFTTFFFWAHFVISV